MEVKKNRDGTVDLLWQLDRLPRRSIQGAYIRREAPSGENLPERMRPDTLARVG
jgi:hypothetical protein